MCATARRASFRRSAGRHFGVIRATVEGMTTPNGTLRAVRMGMLLSQDDFARAIRDAGERAGQPNGATKRLVQRWEAGEIVAPRPVYARALEAVTGLPIASLGFDLAVPMARVETDGTGGHDVASDDTDTIVPRPPSATPAKPSGNYTGVWLSRYEYHSSSRDGTFAGLHYVVVLQHGDRLTVRSLPESAAGQLSMDLTIDGSVLTGTWVEDTNPAGYYKAARYHGAIQLLADPTGRRLAGKWVGFGKDMDVNTGPWTLTFETADTGKGTLARYNEPPTQ